MKTLILPFDQVTMEDLSRVGGKNASLGEMIHHLLPLGIAVPGGFAITADADNFYIPQFRRTLHQFFQ